jgi:hypothetical protein
MRRTRCALFGLGPLVVALAACGGGDDTAVDAPDGVVVEDDGSAEDGPAGAGSSDLTGVVAAIEATGYDCNPDSSVMTSAIRETCLTTSALSLVGYAWVDASTMEAEVGLEVFCSADSSLGQLTSLRGDTWAVSAVPLSGSTSPETQAQIDDVLSTIATTLGGELLRTPCS